MCFKSRIHHILALLAFLQPIITCPGCTVKEDRDLCPCLLEMRFSGDDAGRICDCGISVFLAGRGGRAEGFALSDTLRLTSSEGSLWWASTVPRGSLYVAAVYPSTISVSPSDPDSFVTIRKGDSCPELWMFCEEVSTMCERRYVEPRLHKNYCALTMRICDRSGAPFPFRLEVRGDVCGYDMSGVPRIGEFIAEAKYSEDVSSGNYYEAIVNIPRQSDSSLALDIISDDDKVRTFAIGNYIEASGYDWGSADLKDIVLEIDYARATITFRIDKWQHSEHFEVVI